MTDWQPMNRGQTDLLVAIVRDLAQADPVIDAGGLYGPSCRLCGAKGLPHGENVMHRQTCPWIRARALQSLLDQVAPPPAEPEPDR